MGKWRYGVILDAGSSGTRVYVYRWLNNAKARQEANPKQLKSLPQIKTKEDWTKKIHPGISTFANNPEGVGPDHLEDLLKHALDIVPDHAVKETPVFLLATAGMRLLSDVERGLILDRVCSYFRSNSDFLLPDCGLHIQVIPGETEGLYGWIAANYLLGSFDSPEDHEHGKGHHTYGFLDMGGASAQIAFAPNATEAEKHANDLKLLRLRNVDGSSQEHRVFVTSWLEFGVREARLRYVKAIQEASAVPGVQELPDPCLPSGLRTTLDGQPLSEPPSGSYLIGTGQFDECLRRTYPLLDKDAPCADEPCLLHGVHVPAIDFDVNHFVGISEYWHTTHEIFEMGHKDKAYDFNTYQQRVDAFCSQDWAAIESGIIDHRWGKVDREAASEVCFKASWIINMLHSGIGIPRVGLEDTKGSGHNGTKEVLQHGKEKGFLDPFQPVNKIDSTEISWTLGKVVLYASSQVPPVGEEVLPVGFGSNQPGIPEDFHYPSVELGPGPNGPKGVESEHWHDALFNGESPRRVPGFLLFVLIVIIALFFLCGRSRRHRIYHRIHHLFKRNGGSRGASRQKRRLFGGKLSFVSRTMPAYERVMEEGAPEFELGDVDSDDENESGQASESGSASPSQSKRASRNSGSRAPGLKVEFDNSSTSSIGLGIVSASGPNVLDRQGLVVRTESREHLAPMATNGRRSRTVSPTRTHFKSPMTNLDSE